VGDEGFALLSAWGCHRWREIIGSPVSRLCRMSVGVSMSEIASVVSGNFLTLGGFLVTDENGIA